MQWVRQHQNDLSLLYDLILLSMVICGRRFVTWWASNGLLNNLLSYYKLDSDATDAHGSNDGTASNISWDTSDYVLGSAAADFNGTSSKIDFANYTVNNNASVNLWFQTTSTGTWYMYASRTSNPVPDRFYIYLSSGNVIFTVWVTGNTANSWYNDGNWHMATLTKSGNTIKYYLDAVYTWTFTDTTTINTLVTPALWYLRYATTGYFAGSIDEFGVRDTALTDWWVSLTNLAWWQIWYLRNSWAWLPYSSFTS